MSRPTVFTEASLCRGHGKAWTERRCRHERKPAGPLALADNAEHYATRRGVVLGSDNLRLTAPALFPNSVAGAVANLRRGRNEPFNRLHVASGEEHP